MWILESNGDSFQGVRHWLRPGQRYLFGRVKKDGVLQTIDHKGVSRRHCLIEVDKPNPGDGSLLHTRSKVTVKDENSKTGTIVDGKPLNKGTGVELSGREHFVRLGSYPDALTIRWQPVCLSFFLTSKEKKAVDPLGAKQSLLEPLDIKTIQPFIASQTTHVVATKRNTVPGVQALITGKFIVDHSYIDALVFATTPEDLEGDENLSPLEKDFDGAWPDPLQHLPPKGREPTDKPAEAYAPNSTRENVFEGWTLVFLESGQYENVLPAITTGHGKALLFPLQPGETTADDIVAYMRNAAGEKGLGTFDQSADTGGVIVVKPILKGELSSWGDKLANEVATKIDRKCIDQADFLDAVLSNDASVLTSSVSYESIDDREEPHPIATSTTTIQAHPSNAVPRATLVTSQHDGNQANGDSHSPQATHPAPAEQEDLPRKRLRMRAPPVSRFKAFDDEFDMNAVASYELPEESVETSTRPRQDAESTPVLSDSGASEINSSDGRSLKRGRSPVDDAMVEGLLPAATALKRRRLEIAQNSRHNEARTEQNRAYGAPVGATRRPKAKKDIDVRQVARERREAEEAARRDEEALESRLGDFEVEEMKNLAVVEEMEIPGRTDRGSRASGDATARWDETWNGRKNFKKFRRKGQDAGNARGSTHNMIVPLIEVKGKNYGIGEAYWSNSRDKEKESGRTSSGRSGELFVSQTQTQSQMQISPSTEEPTPPAMTRLQQEAADIGESIVFETPRKTRLADKTQQSQQTMNSNRGKRPATSAIAGGGTAAKRQRTIRTRAASESESDEDLRFKFGRGKR